MALQTLLGEKVVKKDNAEVETSTLEGDGKVVGLYFSAHWCPPCRAFTPKLAEWYERVKGGPNGSKFDIIFLSSDRDEASFGEYFKEMPWLAVPFSDRNTKNNLSKKFKVTGIPTLVLLNGATGVAITQDGRSVVTEDPNGADFPWNPKPLRELIGDKFLQGDLKEIGQEAIDGKILGLYFSAHWCGPCRNFTPQLVKTYKQLKEAGKQFEIIFCSSDRDEESFKEYFSEMPWISLPYNDPRKKALSRHFDVTGIPSLAIVDENHKVITTQGRGSLGGDPEGTEFPWYPKPLNKMTGSTAGQINDNASLIMFTNGDAANLESAVEALGPVAKEYVAKWKSENKEQEVCFFYTGSGDGSDDDIVQSLRQFANLPDRNPLLCIIDIPNQLVYLSDENNVSEQVVRDFLEKYLSKALGGKPLRAT